MLIDMSDYIADADKTILDNSDRVGNNSLTYMEPLEGLTTRCKICENVVQMLESKSARETVGYVNRIPVWPKLVT